MFSDITQVKLIAWVFLATITLFYVSFLPFNIVASGYFLENWYNDPDLSINAKLESIGYHLSLPLLISASSFPIFGCLVDKVGHRIHLLFLSAALLFTAYILILNFNPIIPLICLGLAYGIFGSVLWPMVVFLVPERIYVMDYSFSLIYRQHAWV